MILTIQPSVRDSAGRTVLSSRLVISSRVSHEFFFAVEEGDYAPVMEKNASPHLISQLMHAMRYGGVLHVQGKVCPVLMKNLETFMRRWILWYPELFRWVDIRPEGEWYEPLNKEIRAGAISGFSGGVDSFYSYAKIAEDHQAPLRSVVFLNGFDIDLKMDHYFEETANFYRERLQQKQVKIIKLRTNAYESARKFQLNWGKVGHGIYLGAALHLLGHNQALACIASSHSPDSPVYPWGSNPVTDPLLSSANLKLVHHNYFVSRYEKIVELAERDDCLEMIRVCWRITENQLNCGYCPKCMATLLALEVAKPDSWRMAFPKVRDLDSVFETLHRTVINRFQIEQIEIVRHHAVRAQRLDLAAKIAELIDKQTPQRKSWGSRLRRWYYDLRLS